MDKGEVALTGEHQREVFNNIELLESIGLGVPQITYLMKKLKKVGWILYEKIYLQYEDAKKEILNLMRRK